MGGNSIGGPLKTCRAVDPDTDQWLHRAQCSEIFVALFELFIYELFIYLLKLFQQIHIKDVLIWGDSILKFRKEEEIISDATFWQVFINFHETFKNVN